WAKRATPGNPSWSDDVPSPRRWWPRCADLLDNPAPIHETCKSRYARYIPRAIGYVGRCDLHTKHHDTKSIRCRDRSALAGQAHVPFCKGFEGHQGALSTTNHSYFLFCSAFFSSAATASHSLVKAVPSLAGNLAGRPCRGCPPTRCPSASPPRPN